MTLGDVDLSVSPWQVGLAVVLGLWFTSGYTLGAILLECALWFVPIYLGGVALRLVARRFSLPSWRELGRRSNQ